jgi:hypothetical protein
MDLKKKPRKIKKPTESMRKYYEDLYLRNQSKWMRRSKLEQSHLGSEFIFLQENHKLLGSSSSTDVVLSNLESGEFYIVHIDDVTPLILN